MKLNFNVRYIKSINELFGINRVIRNFRFIDEHEAVEIEIYVKRKLITNLKTSSMKHGESNVQIIEFDIPSLNGDHIRVEFLNYLPIVKLPGTTDYLIYMNNQLLYCSRTISKKIFEMLVKIYSIEF
jgi:hypothetical protein